MKAALRVPLIVGSVLAILVIVAIGLFRFFIPDMCRNEVIAELPSPQGSRKVVVFQRDCGATTGFSTQASILGITQLLKNEAGNVLISDTDHGGTPSSPGGGSVLGVLWQSENAVQLSVHPKARMFKQESDVGGIHVSYAFSENGIQQDAPDDAPKAARP